ncbi:hypothetical protein B7463_g3872, partial [Scytalidium lignicola]
MELKKGDIQQQSPTNVKTESSVVETPIERLMGQGVLEGLQEDISTMNKNTDNLSDTFLYVHTVLATRIELTEDQARLQSLNSDSHKTESTNPIKLVPRIQSLLHHWDCTNPQNSVTVHTTLNPEDLSCVGGFHDHGAFNIPLSFIDHPNYNIHQFLSSLARDIWKNLSRSSEHAIIDGIINRLTKITPTTSPRIFVKLYSISVIGSSKNILFDGPSCVWKWVNPKGIHRKAGCWEATADKAVVDGEFSTRKNLKLLVHGLTPESKEQIIRQGEKTTKQKIRKSLLGFDA